MHTLTPFHIAIPVSNLEEARTFYRETLGCSEGRSDSHWVDFNLFGHQLVIHYAPDRVPQKSHNAVDGHDVPVPHYGVVLEWEAWHRFVELLKAKNVAFAIEPYIRFKGQVGEQATTFFYDPSGNALEFKAFKNIDQLFAK
ncbi:MAG: VOC family protein [Saprospiraceae bacterium]|nr:VOC family protein [Lewinellaceae bacterium]